MNFKGKVALVVEGERRIGKAVSLALISRGARVIIAYSKSGKIIDIPKAYLFKINPLRASSLKKRILKMKEAFGSIDILINYLNTDKVCSPQVRKIKEEYESFFKINFRGFYNYIKTIIPVMIRQGYGRIVNVCDSPIKGHIDYMRIRNEIMGFTKIMGRELAKKNIYMNAVAPGGIEGEDYSKIMQNCGVELSLYLPVQRLAKIEEIVEPILFLASDKAGYIFGETIRVDAGFPA